MDLGTMMSKIDLLEYLTASDFFGDIELICFNALEYNPERNAQDKTIRHRACALKDAAQAILDNELDPDFEKLCEEIKAARQKRGELTVKDIPSNYYTKPLNVTQNESVPQENTSQNEDNNEEEPEVRKIQKRVRWKRTHNTNTKISPWCRPSKKRYKIVTIYVDKYGREINKDNDKEQEQSEDENDDISENDKDKSHE